MLHLECLHFLWTEIYGEVQPMIKREECFEACWNTEMFEAREELRIWEWHIKSSANTYVGLLNHLTYSNLTWADVPKHT